MGKSDHWYVGRKDAANGEPRYKFQDPHLQKLYDEGYNSFNEDPMYSDRDEFKRRYDELQQKKPRW